ncbi:hypothetical protein [Mesoflavibacter profundi]|uniref:hypothetical protein n=1 Tax=Mesoflavibacter profundi TaxID=2708110 RepID=UPI003518A6E8
MAGDKNIVEVVTKAKGSLELKQSLQINDIKAISTQFNESYVKVRGVIEGKHFGHPDIVECAKRISDFYKEVNLTDTVSQIISSYGPINQDRN